MRRTTCTSRRRGTSRDPGTAAPRWASGYKGGAVRRSFETHLTVYVLINLLLIGIWAASGGGYFWPIWPILGWGMGVACHAAPLIAGVGSRSRRRARRTHAHAGAPRRR